MNLIVSDTEMIKLCNKMIMPIITVYDSPADFPGKFVARLFDMSTPTKYIVVKDSYTEILGAIPYTMIRMDRDPSDVTPILESWM